MKIIAKIYTDMPEKFGIPRQSGLVKELTGKIVFEPRYRVNEALSGIEDFSHLWIIWQFSESIRNDFSPTVRPPRLNGNKRKGVFATRSPFRPNPIGLSCVKLEKVKRTENEGTVLYVSGVDMKNETPIYDIKPYISYTDCIPNASCGFADRCKGYCIDVEISSELLSVIPAEKQQALIGMLRLDPRPAYHNDSDRIYALKYMNFDVRFKADKSALTVIDIIDTSDICL